MRGMATPDIVIAVVIALSAVIGLMRGLVKEVVSLVIWVTAFLSARAFAAPVADLALGTVDLARTHRMVIGFALVFICVLIAGAFVQRLLAQLVKATGLTGTDRVVGLVFGGARGAVIVIVGLIALRPFAQQSHWWSQSTLLPELLAFEDDLLELIGVAEEQVGVTLPADPAGWSTKLQGAARTHSLHGAALAGNANLEDPVAAAPVGASHA